MVNPNCASTVKCPERTGKMIELSDLPFEPKSGLTYSFKLIKNKNDLGILNAFIGNYGIGSAGNDSGNFMGAIIAAGLWRYRARYLVLDFRELVYEMSDSLAGITPVIKHNRSPNYPVYILVSDKSRKGIISLIEYLRGKFSPVLIDEIKDIFKIK
jgi:hypothetical protein